MQTETQTLQQLQQQVAALTSAVQLMARIKGERLTTAQVVERLGRTRQTITAMVRRGEFPAPCKDGKWLLAEILEWESPQLTHYRPPAKRLAMSEPVGL